MIPLSIFDLKFLLKMETSTDLRTSTGATAHILLHNDFIEINSKDEFPTITDVFAVKAEINGV